MMAENHAGAVRMCARQLAHLWKKESITTFDISHEGLTNLTIFENEPYQTTHEF